MSLRDRLERGGPEPLRPVPGRMAARLQEMEPPGPAPPPAGRQAGGARAAGRVPSQLEQAKATIHARLVERYAYQLDVSDRASVLERIAQLTDEYVREAGLGLTRLAHEELLQSLLNDVVGLGPLEQILADESVSEVMVNGAKQIYVERGGVITESEVTFQDEEQLYQIIDRIVSGVGRRVDESSPMVDARLKDGSRVNVVLPPLVVGGACLTIRRFPRHRFEGTDLLDTRTVTEAILDYLESAVRTRLNVVISGGASTGKTTLLNVLSGFIPAQERIITIEDAAELRLQQRHVISMEARPPNVEGEGMVAVRDLVRNALRMRPDRIIVGECRGGEALDMLQAMNTGHDGTMSTIHSNSAGDAVSRLETMVLSGSVDLPIEAIRTQIVRGINLMVHQARMPDGRRKIVQISELTGYDAKGPVLRDIYVLKSSPEGLEFIATGAAPSCIDKLAFYGVNVPAELFDPAAARYSPAGSDVAMPVRPTGAVARPEADVRVVPVVLQVTQAQVNQAQSAPAGPAAGSSDPAQGASSNGTPDGAQVVPVVLPAPATTAPPAPGRHGVDAEFEYGNDSEAAWGQGAGLDVAAPEPPAQLPESSYDPLPLPSVGGHLTNQVSRSLELRGLHPRLAAGLTFVHAGHSLQAGTYMRLARVTPAIAGRDLRSALRAGLLAEDPDGHGGYAAGENLDELIRTAMETPAAPEPAAV